MSPVIKKLLFGTAGIPKSTPTPSTLAAIERIAVLKLDCLEVEFVQGVRMSGETAEKIKEKATALNIGLSAHAPYYINLNASEQGRRLLSRERLLSSARQGELCGAKCVVFHAGYYGKDTPVKAYKTIKIEIEEILSILKSQKNPVSLRIETMGKLSQFGSLDEVLFICRELEGLLPCLDFSHILAREGKVNSYIQFQRILSKVQKKLGQSAIKNLHIHISGVEYNKKGEMKHLNLRDSDFHYEDLIRALKDCDGEGMVICESPNLEQDALMLQKLYWSHIVKITGK